MVDKELTNLLKFLINKDKYKKTNRNAMGDIDVWINILLLYYGFIDSFIIEENETRNNELFNEIKTIYLLVRSVQDG